MFQERCWGDRVHWMSEVEDIFTDPDPTNTATHVLCPFNQTNGIQLCPECSVERLDVTTKNRIILTKQSGRHLKLKVVIRCRKK